MNTPPPSEGPIGNGSARESGLAWPRHHGLGWPPDSHLALSLLAAVPVWLALALLAGDLMRKPTGWWAWASLALVQPLLEELLFRGVLYGQVLRMSAVQARPRRLGPITLANALVTLAFVLLHLQAQPWAWALAVAAPSLVLGHLRERCGSVWPAVLVHAVYNAGFGVTAWLAQG